MRTFCLVALLALGCSDEGPEPVPAEVVERLSPTEHLVRASMAIRGVRPGIAEIEAVEADPGALPSIVDYYLTTDEFGATVRDVWAEGLLLGIAADSFPAGFAAVGELADRTTHEINVSIIEAPLRLIEYVVVNDRPFHEIVTADYTLADEIVATVWGLPYDNEAGGWQVTTYEDGRDVAGILSDGFIFTRHSSTFSNKNRGRASQISRGLLCYDFLDRHVEIDTGIDLADAEAVANAIRRNDACVSCHQTLDPLAAYFANHFPIRVPSDITEYPVQQYAPELAFLNTSSPHTAYFGQSGNGLHDLGVRMATDTRFEMCATRRFYSHLTQVEVDNIPLETVSRFRDVLVNEGQNVKAMVRAIVLSDEFASRRVNADATDDEAARLVGMQFAAPEQLARMMEDFAGYRWETDFNFDFGFGTIGRIDLMRDPFFGYSVLGGGTDSISVTRPTRTVSASTNLVLSGLAGRTAIALVRYDLNEPDPAYRRLLTKVDDTTQDEATIRDQLVDVHLRFYGQRVTADSPEIDALWTLWSGALADPEADPWRAWQFTIFAMLQDIRIAYY